MEAQLARVAARSRGATAAQRYRAALDMLANREFEKAVAELTQAIVLDRASPSRTPPRGARGSAWGATARRRTTTACRIELDENLGTPLYGLAECYRVSGREARGRDVPALRGQQGAGTSARTAEDLGEAVAGAQVGGAAGRRPHTAGIPCGAARRP